MTDFVIRPMRDGEAALVAAWAYEAPFDIYDGDPANAESLTQIDGDGFGYYGIIRAADDEVVGFCCFGPEARVEGQTAEDGTLVRGD